MLKGLIWAVTSIVVNLFLNHLAWNGSNFASSAMPVVNFLVFLSGGFVFYLVLTDKANTLVTWVFIGLHLAVFSSCYIADYHEWTAKIAAKEHVTKSVAVGWRNQYLRDN